MYRTFFKTIFDFILSTLLLVLLSPVFFLICLLLLIMNRGKVFFVQSRPGYKGQSFRLIKFCTMSDNTSLNDVQRTFFWGKILRSLSLDEIPQLINVLKGEMSLVGPRPLLEEYLPLYNDQQMRRHDVKPGITGLAQVSGRNALTWKEKFECDIYYVDNISVFLDFKILSKTFLKLLYPQGVNARPDMTMEKFKGN